MFTNKENSNLLKPLKPSLLNEKPRISTTSLPKQRKISRFFPRRIIFVNTEDKFRAICIRLPRILSLDLTHRSVSDKLGSRFLYGRERMFGISEAFLKIIKSSCSMRWSLRTLQNIKMHYHLYGNMKVLFKLARNLRKVDFGYLNFNEAVIKKNEKYPFSNLLHEFLPKNLTQLHGNTLNRDIHPSFQQLARLKNLKILHLHSHPVRREGRIPIEPVTMEEPGPYSRLLSLEDIYIPSQTSLQVISALRFSTKLRKVNLDLNNPMHFESLAELLKKVKEIDFRNFEIQAKVVSREPFEIYRYEKEIKDFFSKLRNVTKINIKGKKQDIYPVLAQIPSLPVHKLIIDQFKTSQLINEVIEAFASMKNLTEVEISLDNSSMTHDRKVWRNLGIMMAKLKNIKFFKLYIPSYSSKTKYFFEQLSPMNNLRTLKLTVTINGSEDMDQINSICAFIRGQKALQDRKSNV